MISFAQFYQIESKIDTERQYQTVLPQMRNSSESLEVNSEVGIQSLEQ